MPVWQTLRWFRLESRPLTTRIRQRGVAHQHRLERTRDPGDDRGLREPLSGARYFNAKAEPRNSDGNRAAEFDQYGNLKGQNMARKRRVANSKHLVGNGTRINEICEQEKQSGQMAKWPRDSRAETGTREASLDEVREAKRRGKGLHVPVGMSRQRNKTQADPCVSRGSQSFDRLAPHRITDRNGQSETFVNHLTDAAMSRRNIKPDPVGRPALKSSVPDIDGVTSPASTLLQSDVMEQQLVSTGTNNTSSQQKGFYVRRAEGLIDLPLPPMLRPAPKLKDHFKNYEFVGVFRPTKPGRTMEDNFREAPFSTAFAMNPYAHALGTSLRECCFTGLRLPSACLLDFHLTASENRKRLAMLPLSLAAALVPKNKSPSNRTPQENLLVAREASARRDPQGHASYVTTQQTAIRFVSENEKRVQKYAMSRRAQHTLSMDDSKKLITWPEDMDDVVLSNLRKLVVKKLRFYLQTKDVADKPGLVATPPGGGDNLSRLQETNDVMCILKLGSARGMHDSHTSKKSSENNTHEPTSADTEWHEEHVSGRSIGFLDRQELDRMLEQERKSFLKGVQHLPPPLQPSSIYYPTVRYRDRRVAVYSLGHLLDPDCVADLVRGTVFERSVFVVMCQHLSLIDLQLWLLKLQSYLAKSKLRTYTI